MLVYNKAMHAGHDFVSKLKYFSWEGDCPVQLHGVSPVFMHAFFFSAGIVKHCTFSFSGSSFLNGAASLGNFVSATTGQCHS
jgi:hypothetical protein